MASYANLDPSKLSRLPKKEKEPASSFVMFVAQVLGDAYALSSHNADVWKNCSFFRGLYSSALRQQVIHTIIGSFQ
jgi:hypothetical protein